MKYQIVLEINNRKLPADDEFEKIVRRKVDFPPGYKVLYARSLEGIRPEAYEPQPARWPKKKRS